MILLVSEKFFKKNKKKLVKYKDYAIGDATDKDSGSKYTKYNNTLEMREFNATPKLLGLANDPKSEESKITAKRIDRYLDQWLGDENIKVRIVAMGQYIVDYNKKCGEDINIILVLRKEVFKCYAKTLRDRINEVLDTNIAVLLTKDLDDDELREILETPLKKKKLKKLAERVEKLAKKLNK